MFFEVSNLLICSTSSSIDILLHYCWNVLWNTLGSLLFCNGRVQRVNLFVDLKLFNSNSLQCLFRVVYFHEFLCFFGLYKMKPKSCKTTLGLYTNTFLSFESNYKKLTFLFLSYFYLQSREVLKSIFMVD